MMRYSGRDLILGGLFLAMALIIPVLFHAVGLGSSFLPMFYPIIIAGFLLALPVAVAVGFLAPLASALLTGMAPLFPPIAFIMMLEGVFLAGIPAIVYQRQKFPLWLALFITILIDRLVLFGSVVLAAKWLDLPQGVLGVASLVRSLPGVLVIFVIIPPLVRELEKRFRLFVIEE